LYPSPDLSTEERNQQFGISIQDPVQMLEPSFFFFQFSN
jgi:hypothetical protein